MRFQKISLKSSVYRFNRSGATVGGWCLLLCAMFVVSWSAAACEITSISSSSGTAGELLTVSVLGVGFSFIDFVGEQGFSVSFGPGIQATIINSLPLTVVPLSQELIVDLVIDSAAASGLRTVTVTSLANEQFCSQDGFTVTASGDTDNLAPLAQFFFTPNTPFAGEPINFDASGSFDPDGQIVQYLWDFGDGTFGQGMSTTHIYLRPESYVVALTVVDDLGMEGMMTQFITLQEGSTDNQPPVANFAFVPDSPGVGDEVRFDASDSFDPDGEIVQFLWDFGDDDVGEGISPTHMYALSGSYLVGLIVVDNDGLSDDAEEEIFVPELPPPVETSCDVKVGGKFEPAQGVWQDDIIFADMPTKQLTQKSPNNYVAELKLVEDRPTLLFGARDTNHNKIHVDVTTTGNGDVILQAVTKLRDSKGERELFRGPITTIPCTTPGQIHHDFDFNTSNGIPAKSFTVAAGSYSVWIEVNKVGSPEIAGKITVSGQAVKTHSPEVLFVPFAINRNVLTSTQRKQLVQAAINLDSASKKFIPDYFPLKPNGFSSRVYGASRFPTRVHVFGLQTGDIPSIKVPSSLRGSKVTSFIKRRVNQVIIAKIENRYFTISRKFGRARERRVVLVMPQSDLRTLQPGAVAVTFSTPHKVIFAQQNTPGSHWDVAHELAHSLPETTGKLWSPKPACNENYHNTGKVGAGHRITQGGVVNRKRLDNTDHIMGSVAVPQWISQCTYWHLLKVLSKTIPDPELLLIRGYLLDMETDFAGWFLPALTDEGTPSQLPAQGSFFVIVRDQNGNELTRHPFEPFWQYSDDTKAEIVSINLAIPKPTGTAQIELHGPQGLLHTLSAGSAPPSVKILNVDVEQGKVAWTGSDPDGDPLTYILMFSDDNGDTWLPIDETEATQLEVSTELLQSPDLQLKIVVTDGINTSSEIVKSPFPHDGGQTGNKTIEQALDTNKNNVLDDDEIRAAIQLWISGQVVPGTNQTIDDGKIQQLIQLWISGEPIAAQGQTPALVTSAPLSLHRASIVSGHGQFVLNVAGRGIRRATLQVFDLEGKRLLNQTNEGSQLRFEAVDTVGRRWSNGVYLYVVTVHGDNGAVLQSPVKKFAVLR